MKYYGVCDCGMWGEAPSKFDESKHFLKCSHCNQKMYLHSHNPIEAGYRESKKIGLIIIKQ